MADAKVDWFEACSWRSNIDPELTIDKVAQRFGAPDKFAVRKLGTTLGRDGWRHEPQPSSRTDEYMAAHRFDTFEEAHAAIRASRW